MRSKGIAIAVRLKAPDPEAVTAAATAERLNPEISPGRILRRDHWCFEGTRRGRETVSEIVAHYHDIVNPNKHMWEFLSDCRRFDPPDDSHRWVGVLVTDIRNTVSENWTDILCRRGFGLEKVEYSVLWLLGFPPSLTMEKAEARAREITVSTARDRGLLANPVSQKIRILKQEYS